MNFWNKSHLSHTAACLIHVLQLYSRSSWSGLWSNLKLILRSSHTAIMHCSSEPGIFTDPPHILNNSILSSHYSRGESESRRRLSPHTNKKTLKDRHMLITAKSTVITAKIFYKQNNGKGWNIVTNGCLISAEISRASCGILQAQIVRWPVVMANLILCERSRHQFRQSRSVSMTFSGPHVPEQTLETAIKLTMAIISTTKLTRLKKSSGETECQPCSVSHPLLSSLVKPMQLVLAGVAVEMTEGWQRTHCLMEVPTRAGLGGSEASRPISLWAELFSPCISKGGPGSAPSLLYSQCTTALWAQCTASTNSNHTRIIPLQSEHFSSTALCCNDFSIFDTARAVRVSHI